MGEDIIWLVWKINSYISVKLAQPKSKGPHPRPGKKLIFDSCESRNSVLLR